MRRRIPLHPRAIAIVVALGALSSGCVSKPKESVVAGTIDWIDEGANLGAVRVRADEFYDRYHDGIALAVGRAMERAPSAAERGALLRWQMRTTALARECLFRADPLVAVFDAWTLTRQIEVQLSSEAAERRFGPGVEDLRAAITELSGGLEAIAETAVRDGELARFQQLVEASARAYPIEGELTTRTAPVLDHAETARGMSSVVDVAASIERRVQQLTRLALVLASEIPELVRDETELLLGPRLDRLIDSTERAVAVAESLPDVAARERAALMADVAEQRQETFEFLDAQRETTLQTLVAERAALVAAIGEERGAMLEEVNRQRVQTLELVSAERLAVFDAIAVERQIAVEEITARIDTAPEEARALVDHAFLRIVQLLAALAVVVVVALLVRRGVTPN